MNKLDDLRTITDRVLYGLTADETLKNKILRNAAQTPEKHKKISFQPVPLFGMVLVALIITVLAVNRLQPVRPSTPGEITVFAAGSEEKDESGNNDLVSVLPETSSDAISKIEIPGLGMTDDPNLCARLVDVLREKAETADSSVDADTDLNIITDDGTVIRFSVKEPFVIGDKCWSCPEFFELFRQSLVK